MNYPENDNPSQKSVKRYFCYFRLLIHIYMLNYLRDLVLSEEVEIDEALIFRKKLRGGRPHLLQYWVLGMRQRNSGKKCIFPLLNRTRAQILPVIRGKMIVNNE